MIITRLVFAAPIDTIEEVRIQIKVRELLGLLAFLCTKDDLRESEERIMSAISEFAARQTAFNDRLDVAVEGITTDVAGLKAEIEKLQNSPGTITPADQALLDAIEARAAAITTKLEALDALTPPTPPPEA